jgi:hypothetical protein
VLLIVSLQGVIDSFITNCYWLVTNFVVNCYNCSLGNQNTNIIKLTTRGAWCWQETHWHWERSSHSNILGNLANLFHIPYWKLVIRQGHTLKESRAPNIDFSPPPERCRYLAHVTTLGYAFFSASKINVLYLTHFLSD